MSLEKDFSKIIDSLSGTQKSKLKIEIKRVFDSIASKANDDKTSTSQIDTQNIIEINPQQIIQILDSIPGAFSIINLEYTYLYTNQVYKKWFGRNLDGLKVYDFVGIDHFKKFGEKYLTIAFNGVTIDRELQFSANNNFFKLMVTYAPAYDANQNIFGAYVFAVDISHLKETQEALEVKNQELQHYIDSYLQLENFAHIASHDLKAPLKNIISFGDLLNQHAAGKLNQQENKFLGFIQSSAINMQSTIKGLLDFSLLSNQKPVFEDVSPTHILKLLKSDLATILSQNNAQLNIGEMPESIVIDPVLFRQLLQNLILNGIKFCDKKNPIINVTFEDAEDRSWFYIQDNGIGIEEEYLQKIFAVFTKLHGPEQYEGTGIGLALSKKIVDHHQGEIFVKSRIGEGSTFYFSVCKGIKESVTKMVESKNHS